MNVEFEGTNFIIDLNEKALIFYSPEGDLIGKICLLRLGFVIGMRL